jgi:hypothetical protein
MDGLTTCSNEMNFRRSRASTSNSATTSSLERAQMRCMYSFMERLANSPRGIALSPDSITLLRNIISTEGGQM